MLFECRIFDPVSSMQKNALLTQFMPLPIAIANCFISSKQKNAMDLRYSYLHGSSASKAVSSKEATHDQGSDGGSDDSVTMLEPSRGDKGNQTALQTIYQKALKHIVAKSRLPLPSCFTYEDP